MISDFDGFEKIREDNKYFGSRGKDHWNTILISLPLDDLTPKQVKWVNSEILVEDFDIYRIVGVYPNGRDRSTWTLRDYDRNLEHKKKKGLNDPDTHSFSLCCDYITMGNGVNTMIFYVRENDKRKLEDSHDFESEVERLVSIRDFLRSTSEKFKSSPMFRNIYHAENFGI